MTGGILMVSPDNGRTWNTVSLTDQALEGVAFSDARHGWAVGGTAVLRTVDGGATFTRSDIASEIGILIAVDFVTSDLGVAVGTTRSESPVILGYPLVLRSADGGLTWQVVPVHGPNGEMLPRAPLQDVCLTSGGLGIAVGNGFSGSVVLVTRDFGISWENVIDRLPNRSGTSTSCVDNIITVVGPGVFRSTDGQTWEDRSPTNLPESAVILGATFADADHGWAVGGFENAPLVLHTDNGGIAWTAQSLPAGLQGNLRVIAAASSAVAISIGLADPHGIATTTGGVTWNPSSFPVEAVGVEDVTFVPAD